MNESSAIRRLHIPRLSETSARARVAKAKRADAVGGVHGRVGVVNARVDDPVRDDLRWQYAGAQEQWDIITKGR